MIPTSQAEKIREKKDFYDSNTIQSIKSELLSNNTSLSASSKVLFSAQEQNFSTIANSCEDDEFNTDNDNIDVETDSDTDQQITELKQMTYHNLSDATVKHEEWSKIVKSTMLLKSPKSVERVPPTANDSSFQHIESSHVDPHDKKTEIDDPELEKCVDVTRGELKRVFLPDEEDTEYYNESFTSHNLLNLSDKKRGRYSNGKSFSIENLIGRMVEDR